MSSVRFILLAELIYGVVCTHDGFGYDDADPLGPNRWREKYEKCAGKYQSPIDIEEGLVTQVSLPVLNIGGFRTPIPTSVMTNNGHTVMVKCNYTEPITLSGGPLSSPLYEFSQFHFHWGANDSAGSEDFINNHSYPMELHMVFYNSDYQNPETAQQNIDGTAVLAFFFEVSPQENQAFSGIVSALDSIQTAHSSVALNYSYTLASLLPVNTYNYFTYMGSLTTPPCSEGVRWIDFKHPIHLSHSQLEKFRSMRSESGLLTHNARPIQPLSNRSLWYNVGAPINLEQYSNKLDSGAGRIAESIISVIFCILVTNIIRIVL